MLSNCLPQVLFKYKMLIILILFLNCLNFCWCQKHTWCDPELCGGNTKVRHIACRNYGVSLNYFCSVFFLILKFKTLT